MSKDGREWAQQTLAGLSLEEKIGQMLQVRYYADYSDFESSEYKHLREELEKYHSPRLRPASGKWMFTRTLRPC